MAQAYEESEFSYTVQSNASLDMFPNNSPNNFRIKLPRLRQLPGKWVVALTEISFPLAFNVVSGPEIVLLGGDYGNSIEPKIRDWDSIPPTSIAMPSLPSQFPDASSVSQALEDQGWKPSANESNLESDMDQLRYLTARWEAINEKRPQYLYIYCDIAQYEFIGDKYGPFLRYVGVPEFDEKKRKHHHECSRLSYKPVARHCFDSIEVDITDERGRDVSFVKGVVIATLHFKRVREEKF